MCVCVCVCVCVCEITFGFKYVTIDPCMYLFNLFPFRVCHNYLSKGILLQINDCHCQSLSYSECSERSWTASVKFTRLLRQIA